MTKEMRTSLFLRVNLPWAEISQYFKKSQLEVVLFLKMTWLMGLSSLYKAAGQDMAHLNGAW